MHSHVSNDAVEAKGVQERRPQPALDPSETGDGCGQERLRSVFAVRRRRRGAGRRRTGVHRREHGERLVLQCDGLRVPRRGVRYFTIGVQNLRAVAEDFGESAYEVVEPVTEFAPVPGMGWMFVADPDGNWIELFGTL